MKDAHCFLLCIMICQACQPFKVWDKDVGPNGPKELMKYLNHHGVCGVAQGLGGGIGCPGASPAVAGSYRTAAILLGVRQARVDLGTRMARQSAETRRDP